MVSISPKRLRTKLMDRFRAGHRTNSSLHAPERPIPIFETSLSNATMASRLTHEPPADANAIADLVIEDLSPLYHFWCPAIVNRCLQYLASHGLDEEGLYRVPGSSETVKKLKHEFNCHGDLDLELKMQHERQPAIQVADVASLFKQFLRELTQPIMTLEVVRELELVMQTLASLRGLLSTKLQPYEFYLMSILFMHLSDVDAHSSTNKMDVHNLSIVFCSSSNLGIGANLFTALTKHDVWSGLRCANEQQAFMQEQQIPSTSLTAST